MVARDADLGRRLLGGAPALLGDRAHYHLLKAEKGDFLWPRATEEVQEQAFDPLCPLVRLEGAALEDDQGLRARGRLLAGAETPDRPEVLHAELLHVQELRIKEAPKDEAEWALLRAGAEGEEAVVELLTDGLELGDVLEGMLRVLARVERGERRAEEIEVPQESHDVGRGFVAAHDQCRLSAFYGLRLPVSQELPPEPGLGLSCSGLRQRCLRHGWQGLLP
mmetsp:Transcript_94462/g.211766  ORF Transcript_94462/g.211766 Transcript_94462/m.211766 type:complete len:222 (-) Transcript_94462:37-702(-)